MHEQWYDNKALFEMIQELKKDIAGLNTQITETNRLIREYNDLRRKIDECERGLADITGHSKGTKDTWGYIVGGFGILMAIVMLAVR
ncbi:MAG: hypothetical protein PHD40_05625 [Syntrophomonadaceae bacterium]|nr:hypothetical protein [Syntrophomonadaceae bacterium]